MTSTRKNDRRSDSHCKCTLSEFTGFLAVRSRSLVCSSRSFVRCTKHEARKVEICPCGSHPFSTISFRIRSEGHYPSFTVGTLHDNCKTVFPLQNFNSFNNCCVFNISATENLSSCCDRCWSFEEIPYQKPTKMRFSLSFSSRNFLSLFAQLWQFTNKKPEPLSRDCL